MAFLRSNVKVTLWALIHQNLPDWFCRTPRAVARTNEPHYSNAPACPAGTFLYNKGSRWKATATGCLERAMASTWYGFSRKVECADSGTPLSCLPINTCSDTGFRLVETLAQCDSSRFRSFKPSLSLWPTIRHPFGST